MHVSSLAALSPLDGRYASHLEPLRELFSEAGLIRHRIIVELAWLETLAGEPGVAELGAFDGPTRQRLDELRRHPDAASDVKEIEATTRHDVKAVEVWIQRAFAGDKRLESAIPFVHFACTSADINNLAYALMLVGARRGVLAPGLETVMGRLLALVEETADVPMLGRTHGQPATPTTMGKEIANFAFRLRRQVSQFKAVNALGKMNGAVGNFNAHVAAYPDVDWPAVSGKFIESLGLVPNPYTAQIEPHDWIAEYAHALIRINTVLIDLCRDTWGYVSLGYFRQAVVAGEVGSSTMPHKVNPIDFENAEGNLGMANAMLEHFATKLPVSRWQRDLTDSTVMRNIGVALGHCALAYGNITRGLERLAADPVRIRDDLSAHPEVLAEAIQTVMRRHGIQDAYDRLKAFSRGKAVTAETLRELIESLDIPEESRARLLELEATAYTGNAEDAARAISDHD